MKGQLKVFPGRRRSAPTPPAARPEDPDALRRSEERFRLAMEATSDGLWDWDLATGFAYYSPGYTRMLGLEEDELPGTVDAWLALVHPDDRERALAATEACARNEAETVDVEFRMLARDGSWRWVLSRGKAVARDASGRALQLIGTHVDITERKRVQEETKKLEAQLFQARKMESVGRLAGGVAHDFNNMLSVILGRADLASRLLSPDDALHADVAEILSAAERSAELTRQLLAFARQQAASPQVVDLNHAIAGMLKMLGRLIGENVDLEWSPGEDLWRVRIDPAQVDQIVANLVVNARDALGGAGTVALSTENTVFEAGGPVGPAGLVPGAYVVLSVSDTGAGMTEEVLGSVFDPFFTTKEPGKGTGLGLATVYGVVRQNNGYVGVESELGKGSTFRIYLPRCEGETREAAPKAPPAVARGTETILVVEDDTSTLRVAQAMLEWAGYKVLTAHSPRNALLFARKYKGEIDLLLTDVVMPEMNGRVLAERLQALRPGLKCLYMSGYTSDVIARQGILDEGVTFVPKPLNVEALGRAVRAALDAPGA